MARIPTIAATVVAALLILLPPANAYVDRGTDPDDQAEGYDVRSSARRLEPGSSGRVLKVIVRVFEGEPALDQLDFIWGFEVRLDARGGRAFEAVMSMWSQDMAGSDCDLRSRSGRLLDEGHLGTSERSARCSVSVRDLRPRKRVRWRVVWGSGSATDLAPDTGMYA